MKSVIAVIALACLATSVVGFEVEECFGNPSTGCSSAAALKLLVTDGTCNARASGSCTTWSQSQESFVNIWNEYWTMEDRHCDSAYVQSVADTFAVAIAKVWASAAVSIDCSNGSGWGCGWSFADGQTFGIAIAESLASVAVEAAASKGAETADAYCFADIRAISVALVQASANAAADGCADGPGSTFESAQASFTESVSTAVATAIAGGSATACIGESDTISESVCDATATSVVTDNTITQRGNGCGGLLKVEKCSKDFSDACCPKERFCQFEEATYRKRNDLWALAAGGDAPCFCA